MNRIEKNLNILNHINSHIDLTEYSGFGGLGRVMTAADHQRLKSIVNEEEYQSIIASFKTAYYTPKAIINLIYTVINQLGFASGRVLDPAIGSGAFVFNMPDHMRINSVIHGIELDRLTCKIAKAICPDVKILNRGFQHCNFKPDSFDLVIGNPPYSAQCIEDKHYPQFKHMAIHHYFVAKSIALLRKGGLLVMVLPQYCMDNLRDHPRSIMSEFGSLIASFRLPDCMFSHAKITVDVIFYIKSKVNEIAFENTASVVVKGQKLKINEYYLENPQYVIGELDTCNMYGQRTGLTVSLTGKKETVYQRLNQLISNIKPIYQAKKKASSNVLDVIDRKIKQMTQELDALADEFEKELMALEIEKLEHIKLLCSKQLDHKQKLLAEIANIDHKTALLEQRFLV